MSKESKAAANFRANLVILAVSCSILWVIRRFTKKAKL